MSLALRMGDGGASIYVQDLIRFYDALGAKVRLITSVKQDERLSTTLERTMKDKLRKTIVQYRPILIHTLYWKSACITLSVEEAKNIKKIFSPISLAADKRRGDSKAKVDSSRWEAERSIMHQSDAITTVSLNEARIVNQDYKIPGNQAVEQGQ